MSALQLTDVRVEGRGRPRLDGVSLSLTAEGLTLVVGPNGAGKSTLLRVMAGLERPSAGRVLLGGSPLGEHSRLARAAAVAWLPQQPRLEEGLTAEEVVVAARYRFGETLPVARRAARRALAELGAQDHAARPMGTLSGGEAQRVRLASLAAQEAAWWLLDEPANHLDPALRLDLLEVVRARVVAGGGVVLVTHDLTSLPAHPDATVVVLVEGRVAHVGRADDPALLERLGRVFGVSLRAADVGGAAHWVVTGRVR